MAQPPGRRNDRAHQKRHNRNLVTTEHKHHERQHDSDLTKGQQHIAKLFCKFSASIRTNSKSRHFTPKVRHLHLQRRTEGSQSRGDVNFSHPREHEVIFPTNRAKNQNRKKYQLWKTLLESVDQHRDRVSLWEPKRASRSGCAPLVPVPGAAMHRRHLSEDGAHSR